MITKDVRLYTWVDVEEVLFLAQQQNDWPEELVWARTYWDCLLLGIRPSKHLEVLSWLADKFAPHFETTPEYSHILLESLSEKPRDLGVILEETEESPLYPRPTPRLAKPSVLWPPHEAEHPLPLPSDLPPVVAFHSFKGGVGRTLLAIALTQALLIKQPKSRVLLVDGDLGAPGLTWLLHSRFSSETISFVDFLALVHSDPDPTASESIKLVASRVREIFLDGVYVLPAFRLDKQFTSLEVKPEHLIQRAEDPFILTTMLAKLGQLLDVQAVIVDLRAGFSELSTGLLLDPRVYRVLVTRLSGQSIKGTCSMLELLAKLAPAKHKNEPLPALIISQIPNQVQKRDIFMKPYEDQLFEAYKPFLTGHENAPSEFVYELTHFNSSLSIIPNDWDEVTTMIKKSHLTAQMREMANWLPNTTKSHESHESPLISGKLQVGKINLTKLE
jgi:MinD-like ATPase involved in chromosome partitioning or flagellar assembly